MADERDESAEIKDAIADALKADAQGAPPTTGGAPVLPAPAVAATAPSAVTPPTPGPAAKPVPMPPTIEAAAPTTIPPSQKDINTDIAAILKSVQLPERRGEPKQESARTFDTALGADAAASKVAVTPPSDAAPRDVAEDPSPVWSIHTLKSDLQSLIHTKQLSRVKAAALEEEKKRPTPVEERISREPRHHGVLILTLVLFLLAGLAGSALYYLYYLRPLPETTTQKSLVFSESTQLLPIDSVSANALQQQLLGIRQKGAGLAGAITHVVPTISSTNANAPGTPGRAATFAEFMTAFGAHPPDELVRSVSPEFFLGVHSADKHVPVLVIPITNYDYAFKGMLAWEKTLNADLSPLFDQVPDLTTTPEGAVVERTFSDLVMRNYDVRVLRDDTGAIVLYYSFPTRSLLIIAESPYSFVELLSRLQAARQI